MLMLDLLTGVAFIGFAGDIEVTVAARLFEEAEFYANEIDYDKKF